ncbi:MarC family protein [Nitrososphaera sp.]|uniref:MarC family protein n=1 Tax=Nitrososphaera sp. TaxID=1971748 RepID=UPI0002617715|nr:putative membrane protein, MarC family [uncultured archaeon]
MTSGLDLLAIPDDFAAALARSTIALFVVIDPLGAVPLYLALTGKMEHARKRALPKTIIITAASLLFAFALAGNQIFAIFGITLASFMIAGGVLLFIVAVELLTRGGWRFGDASAATEGGGQEEEAGIVPLAFPLLAGPGAITAVIISLESAGLIVTTISILAAAGATYVILRFAGQIYRVLGRRGSLIVTRVFAVFVAAIAVQYVVQGALEVFGGGGGGA